MKAAASGRAVQHLAARRGTRRCMLLALAGAFGAPAWALDDAPAAPAAVVASEDDGAVLQRVVVTSEKRRDNVQSIASAVTVIGGDTVENSEVRNAGDIIRFVPNMTADTTDGHGRPKFYIRGIGLSDASVWNTNPIGTYLDDVYIWNASTVGFPLFDLERVEVLRGPQGTLWGKNTTGGAINFISRKPTFSNDGYVKASIGDKGSTLLEGAYGGALKDDVLAARVSLHREQADRYAQNSFVPGTEKWRDLGLRAQLLAKFSNTFDALLNLHYRDFNGPVLLSGTTAVPTQTRFNIPALVEPTDRLKQKGAALTLNKELPGVLWHHLSLSLTRAGLGLLLGGGFGLCLGILAGLSRVVEELVDPTMQMIRAVPFLALIPLLIVWFGIGESSKILLIAAGAAKPMYLNAYGGVRNVDPKIIEAARIFGLTRWRLIAEIYFPAALPSLMVGLRLSTTMALLALIGVEVINTTQGIGFLMLQAQEYFKTEILIVCVVIYALFGLATDLLVRVLERLLMPWRALARK